MESQSSASRTFQFSLSAVLSLFVTVAFSIWFFSVPKSAPEFFGYALLFVGTFLLLGLVYLLANIVRFRSAIRTSGTILHVDEKTVATADSDHVTFQPTVEYQAEGVALQFKGPWRQQEYEAGQIVEVEYLISDHEVAQIRVPTRTRDIAGPLILGVAAIGGGVLLLK